MHSMLLNNSITQNWIYRRVSSVMPFNCRRKFLQLLDLLTNQLLFSDHAQCQLTVLLLLLCVFMLVPPTVQPPDWGARWRRATAQAHQERWAPLPSSSAVLWRPLVECVECEVPSFLVSTLSAFCVFRLVLFPPRWSSRSLCVRPIREQGIRSELKLEPAVKD